MISREEVLAFFQEVHGHPPFPWQLELAERALAGNWPDAVDAPTGLGKTWSIDVAVLVMADAGLAGRRDVFRRVFFVVDRRTVVDQAWEHALRLRSALITAAAGSVVRRIADGLRALRAEPAGSGALEVVRMRGGATWDSRWVDRPDQPVIVLSTVDQVGSRLLFRGFGVSDRMRPIHAALVGCHSLLILDEVHLARPFAELVGHVRSAQSPELPVVGLRTVLLSATHDADAHAMVFDEDAHLVDHEARRRLLSDKRLAVLDVAPAQREATLAAAVSEIQRSGEARILVVCNTVASARGVHSRLETRGVDAGLLTGRSRGIDRELVVERWLAALGPAAGASGQGCVLVATQTVEVGVDLDVDWLISEECSLNALVQRLGRVNRFGRRAGAALVVAGRGDDPVYGDAATNTSAWLKDLHAPALAGVRDCTGPRNVWLDVSPLALRRAIADASSADKEFLARLNRRAASSPLTDSLLFDRWAQTSPVPLVDVPVDQYLHGLSPSDQTVTIIWRADVKDGDELAVPVSAAETIELPLASLRAWLVGTGGAQVADLEDASLADSADVRAQSVRRLASGSIVERVAASALRPGDTIIVPTRDGGLDQWGWAPDSRVEVVDVSALANRRGRHLLLLSERMLRPLVQGPAPAADNHEDADESWKRVTSCLNELLGLDSPSPEDLQVALGDLAAALTGAVGPRAHPLLRRVVAQLPNGRLADRVVMITGVGADKSDHLDTSDASDDDELSTVMLGNRVRLDQHSVAVALRAAAFARALGLSAPLITAVETAARWHDVGKLDRRFQAQLWGGVLLHSGLPRLAKSGVAPRSALGRRAARLSGYPPGMRHEALSARLVGGRLGAGGSDADENVDRELIVHLVASHHGRARPWLPTVDDPDPHEVAWSDGDGDGEVVVRSDATDDLDLVVRFDRLNRTYGCWGLALLESIVRLADMACSSEGS